LIEQIQRDDVTQKEDKCGILFGKTWRTENAQTTSM